MDAPVSIVVCTKDRADSFTRLVESLRVQTQHFAEMIVVDCSSPDVRPRIMSLARSLEGVAREVQVLGSDIGLTRQRNMGVGVASADFILFLDDDVVLNADYIARLCQAFQEVDGSVLGIGGCIENETRRSGIATSIRRLFTMADNERAVVTVSGDAGHLFEPKGTQVVPVLSGSNMAFRREVFDGVGLRFDENLPGYALMEDVLFCLEAGQHGRLLQLQDLKLVHEFVPRARWSRTFVRMQIGHSAYVFLRVGREVGGQLSFFVWRLLGRTLLNVIRGIARGEPMIVVESIGACSRVLLRYRAGRAEPAKVLLPDS